MENSVKENNSLQKALLSMGDDDYREIAARGLSAALGKHPLIIVPLILCVLLLGANTWVLVTLLEQNAADRELLTGAVVECYRSTVAPAATD